MSTSPITIAHPREPSSFLEFSPSGPSSPISPTPSSSSSSLSSSSGALSPTLSDFALPPADPWRTAVAEAAAGIYYTFQEYPTPGAVLAPPFRDAPLAVGPDTRVVLLDEDAGPDTEAGRYHVRVRVLATGETGLLPSWNVEDVFERLARLNTDFNEAVSAGVLRGG